MAAGIADASLREGTMQKILIRDGARTAALCGCVAVSILISFGQVQAYSVFPYKWTDTDIPVSYYINSQNIPGNVTQANYISAAQAAFNAWEVVPTSYMSFSYEGSGNAYSPEYVGSTDGHNTIGFWDLGAGGGVALATLWSSGDRLVEFDIRLNTYQNWATDGSANADDIQGVLTHEIGHGIGLAHSDVSAATMWPFTSYGDTSWRTLETDDIMGITALYYLPEPATLGLLLAGGLFVLKRKSI